MNSMNIMYTVNYMYNIPETIVSIMQLNIHNYLTIFSNNF